MATVNPWNSFRIIFFVRVATTIPLPACAYLGGSRQILHATANGPLPAIDGVTLAVGEYVLVKDEVAGVNNGAYLVQSIGGAGIQWRFVRATPWLGGRELGGAAFRVAEGTANAETLFFCTNDRPTDVIGTNPLTFAASGSTPLPPGIVIYNTPPAAAPALVDATGFAGDVLNPDDALATLMMYLAHRCTVPGQQGIGVQVLLQADDSTNALANAGQIIAKLIDATHGATLGELGIWPGNTRALWLREVAPGVTRAEFGGAIVRDAPAQPLVFAERDALNNTMIIIADFVHEIIGGGPGADGTGASIRMMTSDSASLVQAAAQFRGRLTTAATGAAMRAAAEILAGSLPGIIVQQVSVGGVEVQVAGPIVSIAPGFPVVTASKDAVTAGVTLVQRIFHDTGAGAGADGIGVKTVHTVKDDAGNNVSSAEFVSYLTAAATAAVRAALDLYCGAIFGLRLRQTGAATMQLEVGGVITAPAANDLFVAAPAGQNLNLGANGGPAWQVSGVNGELGSAGLQGLRIGGSLRTTNLLAPLPNVPINLALTNQIIACVADGAMDVMDLRLPPSGPNTTGIRYTFKNIGTVAAGLVNLTCAAGDSFFFAAPVAGPGPVAIVPATGDFMEIILFGTVWYRIG